jgi:DNA (cytosine-5)-methyltransferase 1
MAEPKVLDLFCGIGGLSTGFRNQGYSVTSVDVNPAVSEVFEWNKAGEVVTADLSATVMNGGYDLIIGGPPCKPWSSMNVVRRDTLHNDFELLDRFFLHVKKNRPKMYLLENVPPARKTAEELASTLNSVGYRFSSEIVRYSDFGAPTSRQRMILFGTRVGLPTKFFDELKSRYQPASTVRDAIEYLNKAEEGSVPDHVFPKLQTIAKYRKYYQTGKYGWHILEWDQPAPSFGNVVKTYTMHPSGWTRNPPRVISVKESLLLMGFPRSFGFPPGMGLTPRYQMVVDAVSPVFSSVASTAIDHLL